MEQALLAALGQRPPAVPEDRFGQGQPVAPAVRIDRARRQLCAILIGEQEAAKRSLTELSRSARWPLPDTVRAVTLCAHSEVPQLAAALGNALTGVFDGKVCLLVPDPGPAEETRAVVESMVRGRGAAIGHTVPLSDVASSVRWASRLLKLSPQESGSEARVWAVDDHLSLLLMLQDESLARALSAHWLRPLSGLTLRQRARLETTLLAWLEGGGVPEAARVLEVHPQTVRYRLRQIEKLFGPALRDPHSRFELEMTLRGRRMLDSVRRRRSLLGGTARAADEAAPLVLAREARVNGL